MNSKNEPNKSRQNWDKQIEAMLQSKKDTSLDIEMLNDSDLEVWE